MTGGGDGRRSFTAALRTLPVQLPLVMAIILAAVLSMVAVMVSRALRETAMVSAQDRIARTARQIAQISATSVAGRQPRYVSVAQDPAVRRALLDSRVPADRTSERLAAASPPGDSVFPVELWTATGRLVATYPHDATRRSEPSASRMPTYVRSAIAGRAPVDSLRTSQMYAEAGRVILWFVHPVAVGDRVLGYIAHKRRVTAGPITHRMLQDIAGYPVDLYYRNADSSLWATAAGELSAPPPARDDVLLHEERIGSSDVLVGLRFPAAAVLANSRRIVRSMLTLSVVLVGLGALLSWRLTQRLTAPLAPLTAAARTIAGGDYSVRVPEHGSLEVQELAAAFNRMATEIESVRTRLQEQTTQASLASAAKSEFLAMMSHELRTPLNAIAGYVELLRLGLRGPLTEEQRRDLDRVRASQEHLLGLISRVLDLARIEARMITYHLSPLPLAAFVGELASLMLPQAAAVGVQLRTEEIPGDAVAIADPEKLRQVLLNLLSNAIRHTPAAGQVVLSVETHPHTVAISVTDTGPGIPREKRSSVFEPFVQLERSLSRHREGLGLGLAISRDLARGMGGDLVYDAPDHHGARFVVSLPRAPADADTALSSAAKRDTPSSMPTIMT